MLGLDATEYIFIVGVLLAAGAFGWMYLPLAPLVLGIACIWFSYEHVFPPQEK